MVSLGIKLTSLWQQHQALEGQRSSFDCIVGAFNWVIISVWINNDLFSFVYRKSLKQAKKMHDNHEQEVTHQSEAQKNLYNMYNVLHSLSYY